MSTRTLPRPVLILQALYFESLKRVTGLTDQERKRLREDLQYGKAGHHFWQLGLGGRRPRVPSILYWPAEVNCTLSVFTVKLPGESLSDKPRGDASDFHMDHLLHDPKYLVIAIQPFARERDIIGVVRKQVRAIKKRSGRTRSFGGGRRYSIDRMLEAHHAYAQNHRMQDHLSGIQLAARSQTFNPPSEGMEGRDTATEHFRNENRECKLLQLAKHMIDTARKGASSWVAAFPYVYEIPLP